MSDYIYCYGAKHILLWKCYLCRQIKEKNYGSALKDYQGKLLLVAINYNKKTKKHECAIEVMEK